MKTKRIICFFLVIVSIFLLSSCAFNPDKEDLKEYLVLGSIDDLSFAQFEEMYKEYREYSIVKTSTTSLNLGDVIKIKIELMLSEDNSLYEVSSEYTVGLSDKKEFRLFDKLLMSNTDKMSDVVSQGTFSVETKRTVTINEPFVLNKDIETSKDVVIYDGDAPMTFDDFIVTFFDANNNLTYSNQSITKLKITISENLPTGEYVRSTGSYDYSDEDISGYMESFIKAYDSSKDVIEDGDYVSIDYTGKLVSSGEEFSGNSGEDVILRVGDGYYWNTFESKLLGHKEGDEFDLTMTIPSEVQSETLAGKEVVYKVKINKVYDIYTILKENTLFSSVGEMKDAIRVYAYARFTLMDEIDSRTRILYYPKDMQTKYTKLSSDFVYGNLDAFIREQFAYSGVKYTRQQAFSYMYGSYYSNINELINEAAEIEMKKILVAYAVKKKLGFEYTNSDYLKDLKDQATYESLVDGVTYTEKDIESKYDRDRLKGLFVRDKCTDILLNGLIGLPVMPHIDD